MVECYKKIVCLGKTNWTLCSVLFGLLSTNGRKENLQQRLNRRLIIGLWGVKLRFIALSVHQPQISPIHHTDISSAVCQ